MKTEQKTRKGKQFCIKRNFKASLSAEEYVAKLARLYTEKQFEEDQLVIRSGGKDIAI